MSYPEALDPVATFEEVAGPLYEVVEYIAENCGESDGRRFKYVSVIHGDVYLCKVPDENADPYWEVISTVEEGESGDFYETDEAVKDFPEGHQIIQDMATGKRYLVYHGDDC